MNIVIISDVQSKHDSIIPYGLHLAKNMKTQVDLVHVVDKRNVQSTKSPMSDSQTVAPDRKLSQEEVLAREKKIVGTEIDKILSGEGSRLNYPLKINVDIVEDEVESKFRKIVNKNPATLFIMSAEPDGAIFNSQKEMFVTIKNVSSICMFVPPGSEYKDITNAVLLTKFSSSELNKYLQLFFFLENFKPLINAVDVNTNGSQLEMEMKSKSWIKIAKTMYKSSEIKSNILEGKDYMESLIAYIDRNQTDLVIEFKEEDNLLKKILNGKFDKEKKILNNVSLPFLYCSD